ELVPTGAAAASIGVVHGDARVGVGHGGDVGRRPPGAPDVGLPRRLGDVLRAAAAGVVPGRLAPPPGRRVGRERRAAHGGDVARAGGVLQAVAAVARADRHGHARMVEVRLVERLVAELAAAVAVADDVGAHADGGVDGGDQVVEVGGRRLDEEDAAVGAGGRHHVDVDGDLLAPSDVAVGQRRRGPVLVDLAEAAVAAPARRQARLAPVEGEVALGVGVVEGVDDGDGLARPAAGGGQVVGGLDVAGAVRAGEGAVRGEGRHLVVGGDHVGVAPD